MSSAAAAPPATAAPATASVTQIFVVFLTIGATSFGGGVVAYLRNTLVREKHWLDDAEFLELMAISNTLPGLNATNMSILAGNRMRGAAGALAAVVGMCLPGFAFMTIAGILYGMHGDRPLVTAGLRGIAAAAVGLIAATWYQLGRKAIKGYFDAFIIVAAIIAINDIHLAVPLVLVAAGSIAIGFHRPGKKHHLASDDTWIKSLQ